METETRRDGNVTVTAPASFLLLSRDKTPRPEVFCIGLEVQSDLAALGRSLAGLGRRCAALGLRRQPGLAGILQSRDRRISVGGLVGGSRLCFNTVSLSESICCHWEFRGLLIGRVDCYRHSASAQSMQYQLHQATVTTNATRQ